MAVRFRTTNMAADMCSLRPRPRRLRSSFQGVYSVNELSVCPAGTGSSSGSVNAPPSPGGRRDLEGGWGSGGRVMRAKWRERERPSSLAPAHHGVRPGCGDGKPTRMSMHPCQPKCCHRHHQGPQPPPAKVGRLSPHIIPIDCLLLCLPIPSIGFVSLDDALHSTSPTLIHTVITFQYQR